MRHIIPLFLAFPSVALANSFVVSPTDEDADFTTAEAAMGAAASGDEIVLRPGSYGWLMLDGERSLTIRGEGDPDAVRVAGVEVIGAGAAMLVEGITISHAIKAVTVREGSLDLVGVTIVDGGSIDNGYAILATDGARVSMRESNVEQMDGYRGVIIAQSGASLSLQEVNAVSCATWQGGVLWADSATIELNKVDIVDSSATTQGGAIAAFASTLTAQTLHISDCEAQEGGGIYLADDTAAELSDLAMERNRADEDGAHIAVSAATLTVIRSRLTLGRAARGGALALQGGQVSARNAAWYSQEEVAQGGAIFLSGGTLNMDFGVIWGNPAGIGGGIALEGGDAYLRGVILTENGAEAIANAGDGAVEFSTGIIWRNASNDGVIGNVTISEDVLSVDPRFHSPETGGFALMTGSAALDRWVDSELDPDGTAADMGYYGGAMAQALPDDDGDGYVFGRDCDDEDPLVNETAVDRWYDGVDANCDGESDFDQDGDGYDSYQMGGTDCVDTDRFINPSMDELAFDGLDSDCDGLLDPDLDGDGWAADLDCDDTDASIRPDAEETWYDGVDSDCDGSHDFDQDGDGFAAADYGGQDCDDTDPLINPDIPEREGDGIDNDCDGYDNQKPETDTEAELADGGADTDPTDPNADGDLGPGPSSWETRTSCSSAGDTGVGWLIALAGLALAATRRRRD